MNFGGGRRVRTPGVPAKGRRDRDHEDLLLFQELQRREKERTASLLLPDSEEFEPNSHGGSYPLFKVGYARKGSGLEFFAENSKYDYDWLKTPPATPLFPSLEMDAIGPGLVVQRELPIVPSQPPKGSNPEALKEGRGTLKSQTTNTKRPNIFSMENKIVKATAPPQNRATKSLTNLEAKRTSNAVSNSSQMDMLTSNLSKSTALGTNSKPNPNPRSRTTSPLVRSTITAQILGMSTETPPNLRTDRSSSATRGRPAHSAATAGQKQNPGTKVTRQSCSPSVSRGRKEEESLSAQKKKANTSSGSGNNVLGSKMVERVVNARKLGNNEEKDTKPRSRRMENDAMESGIAKVTPGRSHSASSDKSLKLMGSRR